MKYGRNRTILGRVWLYQVDCVIVLEPAAQLIYYL